KWIAPRFEDEKWTLGRQILWNIVLMIFIALLNVYATQLMHKVTVPLWWWWVMLKWVLMLGVLPVAGAELIAYNHYLRQNLKMASQLSFLVQQSPPPQDEMTPHHTGAGKEHAGASLFDDD